MTATERVRAALTPAPQTIPQLSRKLPDLRAEEIDVSLLELHQQSVATFTSTDVDFFGLPAWALSVRPR